MPFQRIIVLLIARRALALSVLLTIIAIVLAVSLALPRKYTASASVVLDVKSPDPIAGLVLPGMTISSYMGTQIELFRSERVALATIDALHIDQQPEMRDAWQRATDGVGDYRAWVAYELGRDLDVKPTKDANIITVEFRATDPQRSTDIANAWTQSYIDTAAQLRAEPARQYNTFFEAQAKQLRNALEQAQTRRSAFQQNNGIVATDDRLDVELTRMTELSTQLVAMEAAADESRNRQVQAGTNGDQLPEVLLNPLLVGQSTELSSKEAMLNEMQEKLGAAHPSVQQLSANIAQLGARIASDSKRVVGSVAVINHVNQSRLEQARAALEQQRIKVLRLKSQRDEAAMLQRDVENSQRAYDVVFSRFNQSSLESQNTQTNVSVVKRASVPASPSSPRLLLNMAAALVLGGMMSIAAVLVREASDRRLRSEEDITVVLRQISLGVLPDRSRKLEPGRLQTQLEMSELKAELGA